jgi:hypothetical protein
MAKKTFFQILQSGEYDNNDIKKLPFRMNGVGPLYEVTLLKVNSDPMDTINNNDYKLKTNDKEIIDTAVKKSILARLVYNHKDF